MRLLIFLVGGIEVLGVPYFVGGEANCLVAVVMILCKCVTVQMLGNNSNKSKSDSRGNKEETEFW
jgi:hypothetical protein